MDDNPRWSLTRLSTATTEPVSATDAKKQLRVEHGDDDGYIAGLIRVAREEVEEDTGRSFPLTTWDYRADAFPDGSDDFISLPRSPLLSVSTVAYTQASATSESTMAATDYLVDTGSEPGRVYLKSGATWPAYLLTWANGVRVRFKAGYATTATGSAANTPERAKQVIKLRVEQAYYGRDDKAAERAIDALVNSLNAKRYR